MFVFVILLAMLFSITSFNCNDDEKPSVEKQAAINSARHWVTLIDSGRYEQSWQIATDKFRQELTARQWRIGLEQIREPYGRVKSRNIKSTKHLENGANGAYQKNLVVEFKTFFENEQSATEFITVMLGKDGAWRVSAYYLDR